MKKTFLKKGLIFGIITSIVLLSWCSFISLDRIKYNIWQNSGYILNIIKEKTENNEKITDDEKMEFAQYSINNFVNEMLNSDDTSKQSDKTKELISILGQLNLNIQPIFYEPKDPTEFKNNKEKRKVCLSIWDWSTVYVTKWNACDKKSIDKWLEKAKDKENDIKKVSDIQNLRMHLQDYFDEHWVYTNNYDELWIKLIDVDTNNPYAIKINNENNKYCIVTKLKTKIKLMKSDDGNDSNVYEIWNYCDSFSDSKDSESNSNKTVKGNSAEETHCKIKEFSNNKYIYQIFSEYIYEGAESCVLDNAISYAVPDWSKFAYKLINKSDNKVIKHQEFIWWQNWSKWINLSEWIDNSSFINEELFGDTGASGYYFNKFNIISWNYEEIFRLVLFDTTMKYENKNYFIDTSFKGKTTIYLYDWSNLRACKDNEWNIVRCTDIWEWEIDYSKLHKLTQVNKWWKFQYEKYENGVIEFKIWDELFKFSLKNDKMLELF